MLDIWKQVTEFEASQRGCYIHHTPCPACGGTVFRKRVGCEGCRKTRRKQLLENSKNERM